MNGKYDCMLVDQIIAANALDTGVLIEQLANRSLLSVLIQRRFLWERARAVLKVHPSYLNLIDFNASPVGAFAPPM